MHFFVKGMQVARWKKLSMRLTLFQLLSPTCVFIGLMYLLVFAKEELKLHLYIDVVGVFVELYIVHCFD